METHLGVIGAEEGTEGFAPTVGVVAQFLEIFLEGESHAAGVTTGCGNLGNAAEHGIGCAMEGAPRSLVGIHAIGHECHSVALAVEQRQFADHALSRRQLITATEGHHHTSGTDGAVEHLDQALLRTYVEVGEGLQPQFFDGFCGVDGFNGFCGHLDTDGSFLMGSVGVDEAAA